MKVASLLLVLSCLGGCMVGPDYVRPEREAPEGFSEANGAEVAKQTADLTRWWTSFGDATLDSLIERARTANLDLKVAAARIREARAQAGIARSDLLPQVDATGGVSRDHASESVGIPAGRSESTSYSAGFDAIWELDFFGGKQRGVEAAEADIDASMEDRRMILVTVFGDVARSYVELRGNQKLVNVARKNIAAAESTLDLTRSRLEGGMSTSLDVARAEMLLADTRARLPGYEASVRVAIHRLGILLGQRPDALARELETEAPIPTPPERILVGLPSELLERRPDVRGAERRLAAATARVGVATAELYPKFSLTGAFGLESVGASSFASAASQAWSIGPTMRWPIFAGGRIRANIDVADARVEQALAQYDQALLGALEEVENALVGYLREWDHRRALTASAAAGRTSVELADDLQKKGLTNFLDVLDAERRLYDAELELAASEASTSLKVVTLYKALGGGWSIES